MANATLEIVRPWWTWGLLCLSWELLGGWTTSAAAEEAKRLVAGVILEREFGAFEENRFSVESGVMPALLESNKSASMSRW